MLDKAMVIPTIYIICVVFYCIKGLVRWWRVFSLSAADSLPTGAYHGHYEAQVFDVQYVEYDHVYLSAVECFNRNNSWYQFNDESVTKMDSLVPALKSSTPKENSQRFVLAHSNVFTLI